MDKRATYFGDVPLQPDGAYLAFFENCVNRDESLFDYLSALNWKWWLDLDDSCYDSISTIEREMTALFGPHSSNQYPTIHRAWRAYDSLDMQHRFNSQSGLYYSWKERYWQETQIPAMVAMLKAREIQSMTAVFDGDTETAYTTAIARDLNFARFATENKGDWTKRLIQQADQILDGILRRATKILADYEQLAGWRLHLRHPIAFTAGVADRILDGRMNQISYLNSLLHHHSHLMFEMMCGFGYLREESNYRPAFDMWNRINATAIFVGHRPNHYWALTPLGLPAPLVESPMATLPLTIGAFPTQSILDQWQHIELLDHYRVQQGQATAEQGISSVILNVGWLVAAVFSIRSVQQTASQGIRKPNWLHSHINAALVDHVVKTAPVILRMAESESKP